MLIKPCFCYPKPRIQDLADDLRLYLQQNDLWHDCMIFFNDIAYTSRDDSLILKDEAAIPTFEYVANPHILSMCFEGPLYEVINYMGGIILEEFNEIFDAYDVYYEQGNAWNLTCYMNP